MVRRQPQLGKYYHPGDQFPILRNLLNQNYLCRLKEYMNAVPIEEVSFSTKKKKKEIKENNFFYRMQLNNKEEKIQKLTKIFDPLVKEISFRDKTFSEFDIHEA